MSDPGAASPTCTAADRLQGSHDVRKSFEKWALIAFIAILVLFCLAALAGMLWLPPGKGAADWGAQIVARAIQLKDTIMSMLEALLGGVGISMTRGHMDARLDKDGDK